MADICSKEELSEGRDVPAGMRRAVFAEQGVRIVHMGALQKAVLLVQKGQLGHRQYPSAGWDA
jgi:hypothetical protein